MKVLLLTEIFCFNLSDSSGGEVSRVAVTIIAIQIQGDFGCTQLSEIVKFDKSRGLKTVVIGSNTLKI